jgi:hypothetical protein
MKHKTEFPDGIPLSPIDSSGNLLALGIPVIIQSVESCAHNLPEDAQLRLRKLVGRAKMILEIDKYGFLWFDSEDDDASTSFCLFPKEVCLADSKH